MNEIEVIRYLLDEIEAEQDYKEEYEQARMTAEIRAEKEEKATGKWTWYSKFMPEHLQRDPKKAIIKDNAKMIRRLALKIFKEV